MQRMKSLVAVACTVLMLTSCMAFGAASPDSGVVVAFRFDDYSAKSNTGFEIKLIETFAKYDMPCTFGVIPRVVVGDVHDPYPRDLLPLGDEKSVILRRGVESGLIEVALHGYNHQVVSVDAPYSEFVGLDFEEQKRRLAEGRADLEQILGITITQFIPPWNAYDLNTLKAMDGLGFEYFSADIAGPTLENTSMRFVPKTCTLSELRTAVSTTGKLQEAPKIVVVLFHEFDFREANEKRGIIDLDEFSKQLEWLSSQDHVRVMTVGKVAKELGAELTPARMLGNHYAATALKFAPAFIRRSQSPKGGYLTIAKARGIVAMVCLYCLTALVGAALIVAIFSKLVLRRIYILASIARISALIAVVSLVLYAFRDGELDHLGALGIVLAFGGTIGLLLGIRGMSRAPVANQTPPHP